MLYILHTMILLACIITMKDMQLHTYLLGHIETGEVLAYGRSALTILLRISSGSLLAYGRQHSTNWPNGRKELKLL